MLEPIYEVYVASIMSEPESEQPGQPGPTFKTFFFPVPGDDDARPSTWRGVVTLREEQKTIQAGTTGLRTWGARWASLDLPFPVGWLP